MKIGELWADSDKPTIDGDHIRGILILGRQSKNPADTDGAKRGTSKVTRKFNVICESAALYGKFEGAEAHIGPHQFTGDYPEHAKMGTFLNVVSTPKGLRADLLCRRIGETFHPQAAALRDNVEHDRPFGGFSPIFDGDVNAATGEVTSVERVAGVDWVPNPGSVRSIVEAEVEPDSLLARRIAECEAAFAKHVAECHAPVKVAESHTDASGGARTVPPPEPKKTAQTAVDPFTFVRG